MGRESKRFWLLLVGVAFLVFSVAEPATSAETQSPKAAALPKRVSLATHSPGTVFHAAGMGLAKVASDVGPIQLLVQPFTGPPSWLPLMMSSGKPELGVINAAEAWQAFTGKATPRSLPEGITVQPPYDRPRSGLRALLLGTDICLGMLVRRDARYQSLPDLKGARVTWGYKGQPATQLQVLALLALAGVAPKDIQKVEVPSAPGGVSALVEGRADVAAVGIGMGQIVEADSRVGVRFFRYPTRSRQAQVGPRNYGRSPCDDNQGRFNSRSGKRYRYHG